MTTNGCLHTQTRVSQMPEASEGHLDIPKDENAVETATLYRAETVVLKITTS